MKSVELLLGLFLLMLPLTSIAQENVPFPIELQHTGDDIVGSRLAYYVKEGLRKSSGLTLSDDSDYRIQLSIVTLDPSSNKDGYSTVYSAVWKLKFPTQLYPFFLNQSVGTCGSRRIEDVADGLVADTDKLATDFVRLIKAAVKKSQKN
jgi:hypothetical protein